MSKAHGMIEGVYGNRKKYKVWCQRTKSAQRVEGSSQVKQGE